MTTTPTSLAARTDECTLAGGKCTLAGVECTLAGGECTLAGGVGEAGLAVGCG
ncbi:hypothetical protein FBY40_1183 [Microbacterium sp. SLBN-154]|nr:hypothetical protein FBY40_1183 [Microbacterium sp. SLBN-154]